MKTFIQLFLLPLILAFPAAANDTHQDIKQVEANGFSLAATAADVPLRTEVGIKIVAMPKDQSRELAVFFWNLTTKHLMNGADPTNLGLSMNPAWVFNAAKDESMKAEVLHRDTEKLVNNSIIKFTTRGHQSAVNEKTVPTALAFATGHFLPGGKMDGSATSIKDNGEGKFEVTFSDGWIIQIHVHVADF